MSDIGGQVNLKSELTPTANAMPDAQASGDGLSLAMNDAEGTTETAKVFNELLMNQWLAGQAKNDFPETPETAASDGKGLPPFALLQPVSLPGEQTNPFSDLNTLLTRQNTALASAPVEGVIQTKIASQQPIPGLKPELQGKVGLLDSAEVTAKFDENHLPGSKPMQLLAQSQLAVQPDALPSQSAQPGQSVQGIAPGFSISQSVSSYSSQAHLPPVTAQLDHPQGAQQLTDRINWMIGTHTQKADMRLDPPELGSLDVRVSVTKDQANVTFHVSNGPARDAVEAAIPRLREMFNDAGVNLGQVDVSQQSFSDHAQRDAEPHDSAASGHHDAEEALSDNPSDSAVLLTSRADGLVDIFA